MSNSVPVSILNVDVCTTGDKELDSGVLAFENCIHEDRIAVAVESVDERIKLLRVLAKFLNYY